MAKSDAGASSSPGAQSRSLYHAHVARTHSHNDAAHAARRERTHKGLDIITSEDTRNHQGEPIVGKQLLANGACGKRLHIREVIVEGPAVAMCGIRDRPHHNLVGGAVLQQLPERINDALPRTGDVGVLTRSRHRSPLPARLLSPAQHPHVQ